MSSTELSTAALTASSSSSSSSSSTDAAAAVSAVLSPTSTSPSFIPAAAPGLSIFTSYSANPAPLIRTDSESSVQSGRSISAFQADDAANSTPHPLGSDGRPADSPRAEMAIDVRDEEVSRVSTAAGCDVGDTYLPSPLSPPTTSPLLLTISLASTNTTADSLPPVATAPTATSSSHLIDVPTMPPNSPSLPISQEHTISLSHQRPSVSVRRLSVSSRVQPNNRSQEDEEEMRWLTQANPFQSAITDLQTAAQEADEQKEADREAEENEADEAAEAEEREEAEAYEELKLPTPTTHQQLPASPIVQPITQASLLPPTVHGLQRVYPSHPSPLPPSSHRASQHISLSYDPHAREPSPSHSSIPLSPSPTPSLSTAASVHSELPPSPALASRPLIVDDAADSKQGVVVGMTPVVIQPRLSPADRRRLHRKIGFALAEHDEADEEEVKLVKPELRPIKPRHRSAKQREAERKEAERRKRQQEKEVVEAQERRFLARDIQERIGSFPRPLLQAVLSCLLTSPPVATLSNLSSSYALTSGQHVLLDLSALAAHWSGAESSLPDELAHGLSVLLGLKAAVLVCDERMSMRDLLYGRKEDDREEKYGGGGGINGGRGSVLSIASLVSSSSTSSPASPNGPLFSPIVVLHNLHLAPHTLHSTLISAGRLGSVTIEGSVVRLPRPLLLVATHSQHIGGGLWCGGSGFSARQLMELFMYDVMAEPTFPSQLRAYLAQQPPMPPILSSRTALEYSVLLPSLQSVTCSHLIRQYAHDLIATLRQHVRVAFGPSPSAAHSLLCAASTHALFSGVGYVTPHDVDVVAAAVLAHRITLRMVGGGVGRGVAGGGVGMVGSAGSARAIVQHLVTKVLVPPK